MLQFPPITFNFIAIKLIKVFELYRILLHCAFDPGEAKYQSAHRPHFFKNWSYCVTFLFSTLRRIAIIFITLIAPLTSHKKASGDHSCWSGDTCNTLTHENWCAERHLCYLSCIQLMKRNCNAIGSCTKMKHEILL